MSSNFLPLLANQFFNEPMLMRPQEYAHLAQFLGDRFQVDTKGISLVLDDPEYKERSGGSLKIIDGIHHVPVIGALAHRAGQIDADCIPIESYNNLRQLFHFGAADKDVKTRLFEFDSCGGQAAGCMDFSRHLLMRRGDKKTIAFVNESAYSAAYAIASACDEIYLTSTAGVGSIGAICGRLDRSERNEKMGVKVELFTSGFAKADGSPDKPLLSDEIKRTQQRIDALASEFFDIVSHGRNLTVNKIKSLEAQCLFGQEAVNYGLADAVMTQDEMREYLQSQDKEKMTVFFDRKPKKESGSESMKTVEERSAEMVQERLKELEVESTRMVREEIESYKKKMETEMTAFVTGINDMCKTANAEHLSGRLIAECSSLEEAREKLSMQLSSEVNLHSYNTHYDDASEDINYLQDAIDRASKDYE